MEHTEDMLAMLHRISSPAFFVKGGILTAVNDPARQHLLEPGMPVLPLLHTGIEEYRQYHGGCLTLSLMLGGPPMLFSVTAVGDAHLFVLEQDADQYELRHMALAAQQLRTPLHNVFTIAERLFPMIDADGDPAAREYAAQINRGLYQMLRVVCNMSDAHQYQSENLPRMELQNICALFQELLTAAEPLIAKLGLQLRWQLPAQPIYTLADTVKLDRALSNMLSNAAKFTPHGGSIDVTLRQKGSVLYLTVQDNGEGLSPAAAATVHRRYQRAPGLEDRRFGLGLGMVLIRAAATAHGGTLLMEEGDTCGLRLTMTIPIRRSTDSTVHSPIQYVDYAGELDHLLLELSNLLPAELYAPE